MVSALSASNYHFEIFFSSGLGFMVPICARLSPRFYGVAYSEPAFSAQSFT
jgi:hypothetical protein